jgi:hypothetical protein
MVERSMLLLMYLLYYSPFIILKYTSKKGWLLQNIMLLYLGHWMIDLYHLSLCKFTLWFSLNDWLPSDAFLRAQSAIKQHMCC